MSIKIRRMTPDTFVEITDILSNGRKIGLVDETGLGYFDLIGDSEFPKPLYDQLAPAALGAIPSWLRACEPPVAAEYRQIWERMLNKELDVLTIARALQWGLKNASTDPELLEQMGVTATEQIVAGREVAEKGLLAN